MSDPHARSREENVQELRRLQRLYQSLPDDKKASQAPHMRKRMQELTDAINAAGKNRSGGGFVDALSKGMLWVAVGLAVLGAGFFGIMALARM